MSRFFTIMIILLSLAPAAIRAADHSTASRLMDMSASVSSRLEKVVSELAAERDRIADEKVPLTARLAGLESELIAARKSFEDARRGADNRNLESNNLKNDIKARKQEHEYLITLLSEYTRNLEARLHISELQLYGELLQAARESLDRSDASIQERFDRHLDVVTRSLARLESLNGSMRFRGRAAGQDGTIRDGQFILCGPLAVFASDDGALSGLADQRLGSLEPSIIRFNDPSLADDSAALVRDGAGALPFDGSLGNAQKMEATKETFVEHIRKGGAVMYPILLMAAAILGIIIYKWIALDLTRLPGPAELAPMFDAVRKGDKEAAMQKLQAIRNPAAGMLMAGMDRWEASRETIEEAMFEIMLEMKFKLGRGLPFVAVGAACAPLLGLLGTVTGIIATFKLITVFGSGDVKMLSAGISEALITTEWGLIVAIPSLLFHSFLSRKSRAKQDKLEQIAVGFLSAFMDKPAAALPESVKPAEAGAEENS